jgi:hypothetical protein
LFCFVCQVEISQTTMNCTMAVHGTLFGIIRKLWMSCTNFGLRLFGGRVWKLLIIEPFSQ